MADRTEGTIGIDAPPAEVLGVIADFEAYPEWATGVRTTEVQDKDDQGRGTKVRFEVSAVGLSGWYVLTYEYLPDDAGITWTFLEGSPMKDLSGGYLLEPDGDGTHVTYHATVDPGIPMIGFMKRKVEGMIIGTALKGLKKRVESL